MRRRDFVIPAAIGGAFAACARKKPAGLQTIQVGVRTSLSMSPFYVASERGYFRDAGIDPRPQIAMRTGDAVALLTAGRLDVAVSAADPAVFNAVASGSAIKVVLGRERVTASCGTAGDLFVRQAAFPQGSATVAKWSGKNLWAGQAAGLGEFMLDTILSRGGVDPKQTPRLRLNHAQALAAILSGSIDGMLIPVTGSVNLDDRPGILREEAGRRSIINMQYSQLLFGPTMLRGDLSLGSRFIACYQRGVKDFESGVTPQFLTDLIATEGSPQSFLTECRSYSTPGGAIDRESIKLVRDWAVGKGYSGPGITVDSIIDERFLERFRNERT